MLMKTVGGTIYYTGSQPRQAAFVEKENVSSEGCALPGILLFCLCHCSWELQLLSSSAPLVQE